ncbi:MAG: ATP-binding protein [Panacagrimonas sp.]
MASATSAYEYATWKKAKAHLDYHVEIERRYYSVPHALISKTVDVRLTATGVEIFHRGQRVAVHLRSGIRGGFTATAEHRPPRHQAVVELSHERLLRDAERIGPFTAAVIRQQVHGRVHPEQTLRRSLGILRLAKDFDPARLEAACERALALGCTSYRTLRALIQAPVQSTLPGLSIPAHDDLRGPSYYQSGESSCYNIPCLISFTYYVCAACLEDLDMRTPRGLQKTTLAPITNMAWITEHLNVLICSPTGVGKSWIACAIGHAACRIDHTVRFYRLPRLIVELTRATAMNNRSSFFRNLAKVDLLMLDDFGLAPLTEQTRRDLLEILDDRYDKKSTLITSQLPVEQWHAYLGDPTLADAILDRVVHNSYRLNLTGESMRKKKTTKSAATLSN